MEKLSSLKYYILVALISLGGGAALQRYYSPTASTEVQVREVIKNNIVTVTREVTAPNGTKETTTTTTDTSVKKERSNSVTVAAAPAKLWHVSLSSTRALDDAKLTYGAQIEYALVGPFSVGVRADTSKQVGVVVGFSF